jgi:hypothetical protein
MRFFYLTILAILIALSGCTMHPPSASGFMETAEQGQNDEKVRVLTARAEKINFSLSGDEWNIPIALETTTATRSGFVSGWGILPSPYVTFGYADKYFGWRSWVSAIWLGITVGAICATGVCFEDDGGDGGDYYSYDYDDDDDVDLIELDSFLAAWTQLFSGGLSFIEQIPIGDFLRIGFEQYICRNFWLNWGAVGDQEDFGNVEVGVGAYMSFRVNNHRVSLDAHYGLLDFNTKKPRLSLAITYSNVLVYEAASSIK